MAIETTFRRAEERLRPKVPRVLHILAVTAGRNGVHVCVTPEPQIVVVASGGSPPARVTKAERKRAIADFLAELDRPTKPTRPTTTKSPRRQSDEEEADSRAG
jgi:hypothetical protein